ncbi:MAG TPA: hypothetical protein VK742_00290, partial [Candidatus Sulfotelmatobacter sp.]|nr:hypothetical protein [Candidatus Sulfotelmatobacter sp.]
MEWNWHTAVNVLLLAIIAGLVVWLLIHSFKNSESPALLIFKWGMTLPIVAFLWLKIGPMIPQGGADTIGGMIIG